MKQPTCSLPFCTRSERWHTAHLGPVNRQGVFDLVKGEWTGTGQRAETQTCPHGYAEWTTCDGCVAAADEDRGAFS